MNKKRYPDDIRPVLLDKFVLGQCFICKTQCEQRAVLHYSCATAYSEKRDKLIKEYEQEIINKENQNKTNSKSNNQSFEDISY